MPHRVSPRRLIRPSTPLLRSAIVSPDDLAAASAPRDMLASSTTALAKSPGTPAAAQRPLPAPAIIVKALPSAAAATTAPPLFATSGLAAYVPGLGKRPLRETHVDWRVTARLGCVVAVLERRDAPAPQSATIPPAGMARPIAAAVLAAAALGFRKSSTGGTVDVSLGNADIYDRTPAGRLYPHVLTLSAPHHMVAAAATSPGGVDNAVCVVPAAAFALRLTHHRRRAADYPGHDFDVALEGASLRVVALARFLAELSSFRAPTSVGSTTAAALRGLVASSAGKLADRLVRWLTQPSRRPRALVHVELRVAQPVVVVPAASGSPRMALAHLGSVELRNAFVPLLPDAVRPDAPLVLPSAAALAQRPEPLEAPLPSPKGPPFEVYTARFAAIGLHTATSPAVAAGRPFDLSALGGPAAAAATRAPAMDSAQLPPPPPLADIAALVAPFALGATVGRVLALAGHPADQPVIRVSAASEPVLAAADEDTLRLLHAMIAGNLAEGTTATCPCGATAPRLSP